MTITKEQKGSALTILLEGSLDTMSAPELEAELSRSLDGVEELIFDFGNLTYISSAGLRAMVAAYKSMSGKGDMKIIRVNEVVMEIFQVTGLDEALNIEPA